MRKLLRHRWDVTALEYGLIVGVAVMIIMLGCSLVVIGGNL